MPKKISQLEFITRANKIHNNFYDYSESVYKNSQTKIKIKCPVHGIFKQIPNSHLLGFGCKLCHSEKLSNLYKDSKEQFIEKAIKIHGSKYDYSKVIYKSALEKVIIVCLIHGDFEQKPGDHLHGQGCSKCRYLNNSKLFRSDTKNFIEKAMLKHGSLYDYSNSIYRTNKDKIEIKCKKHGSFFQRPYHHLNGIGCPICSSSKGELAIKAILDKHKINYIQEYKIPNEKYIFYYDFYLPDYNILIEFHGIQHYKYIPYFHKNQNGYEQQKIRDSWKVTLAKVKKNPLIEINYKQFKNMSEEQFEQLLINKLNSYVQIK